MGLAVGLAVGGGLLLAMLSAAATARYMTKRRPRASVGNAVLVAEALPIGCGYGTLDSPRLSHQGSDSLPGSPHAFLAAPFLCATAAASPAVADGSARVVSSTEIQLSDVRPTAVQATMGLQQPPTASAAVVALPQSKDEGRSGATFVDANSGAGPSVLSAAPPSPSPADPTTKVWV